ncbi:hypothetical protein HGO21_15745 [Acinetobacter sp. CUI P1]|nr:hypothetical protein [Acinetobacter sp. CUI P1]
MQAIWRKEWIYEFETPWSIFEKLSLVNRINRNEIFSFLGNDNVKKLQKHSMGDTRRELFNLSGFNETTLKLIFGIDIVKFTKKSTWSLAEPLAKHKYPIESWFYQNLRWCKRCISNGYHSWLHQFKLLQKCSFHNCDLIDTCPKCNRKIPFLLSNKQMGEPFTCKCSYRMGDFNESLWSTWNRKNQIIDEATLLWLSSKIHLDDRYLLVPEMSNINLLINPISFFLKVRAHQDEKLVSIDDFYFDKNISKYLYMKNAASFHTLDRYIRKKLVNHHYQCIRQFEQLRKSSYFTGNICPNNSTKKKRAISKMESFIPLKMAIDGTKRKQINYVNTYIKKHGGMLTTIDTCSCPLRIYVLVLRQQYYKSNRLVPLIYILLTHKTRILYICP